MSHQLPRPQLQPVDLPPAARRARGAGIASVAATRLALCASLCLVLGLARGPGAAADPAPPGFDETWSQRESRNGNESGFRSSNRSWNSNWNSNWNWNWKRLDSGALVGVGASSLRAVAVDAARGRLALGHHGGVAVGNLSDALAGGRLARSRRVPAVLDLRFDPDGALWIASIDGLWRLDRAGRLEDRSPAPGDAARRVRAVRVLGPLVAAATDAGAYVSADGMAWQALDGGVTRRSISTLTLSCDPQRPSEIDSTRDTAVLWLAAGTQLWRATLHVDAAALSIWPERIPSPLDVGAGVPPVDLALGAWGAEVAVLYPNAIALRDRDGGSWRTLRLSLPPGAIAHRLVATGDHLWIATDRGLMMSAHESAGWRRVLDPVRTTPVSALAVERRSSSTSLRLPAEQCVGIPGPDTSAPPPLWSVTNTAVFRAVGLRAPAATATAIATSAAERGVESVPAESSHSSESSEPSIGQVHAAVLRYVGLRPAYFERLRSAVHRRGRLPTVLFGAGYGGDRDYGEDYDEAFISGEMHRLNDRDRDRGHDWDVSLTLAWDLGDVVYNPDAIDQSRELRQVISLRDDVLDEVTQLYFERRRLLDGLSRIEGAERDAAILRAGELAAGIDAWTGGWFSAQWVDTHARPAPSAAGEIPQPVTQPAASNSRGTGARSLPGGPFASPR